MKILVIAEVVGNSLKSATAHAVCAATKLGQDIDVLVIGYQCGDAAKEAASLSGVKKVLVADNAVYAHTLAENTSALIAKIGTSYETILAGATTFGKNILPRVAALLDVGMVSDITEVISADTFARPIYAGNVTATVQSADRIKVISVRTTAFASAEQTATPAAIQAIEDAIPNTLATFESESLTQSSRPELTSAKIIISGGRGLKSAENFKLIEEVADKLGAAVGASRAAVDAGFAPNDYQVGQTGKIVAPDLYIAVGISGAIQHLAGMKDSKIVVAINSDAEAPIFQSADYILVGDLFKVLPELKAALL
jgi:electron transfer flavoprotein alpha subunit